MLKSNPTLYGILLAVLAAFIWSGNFIVARVVNQEIPPVSLNFYRWLTATLVLLPFSYRYLPLIVQHLKKRPVYFFWLGLTGVSLFNTFVYVGAHYTSAINLALIGTTSSPVISLLLARIFLKEKIGPYRFAGLLLCIAGVLFLLCKGDFRNILQLQFGRGDLWVLLAAFCFSVYNTLVKKKPAELPPRAYLLATFLVGTLLLVPIFVWELNRHAPVHWNFHLAASIAYLGIGASVICFSIWNIAISLLGAGRTALFGNLIPVFSTMEAAWLLHEDFRWHHLVGMILVFSGILLANWQVFRPAKRVLPQS